MQQPPKISRILSQSAVVQAIANFGPVSRASVAKITGLSKQTVSEIVSILQTDGWVRQVGQTAGHIGRRAIVYEISPAVATIASVDLGGTNIRVALCDLTGKIFSERMEPTEKSGGLNICTQIARMVHRAASEAERPTGQLRMAVVGVPGVLDPESGAVFMAPNITGIDKIDFTSALKERLAVEVIVENDVNLAALGEHWFGSAGEDDNLVYMSLGTGIGAGIVIGGQLLRGGSGVAGEIGYLPFGADPFEKESLRMGALERVAATGAIISHYRALSGNETDVPGVFQAASMGDDAAIAVLDDIARQVARAAAALSAIVDPSVIIMGGSIGRQDELLERIAGFLSRCFPRKVKIEKSRLGHQAALAGGISVALSHLHLSLFAEGLKGAEISVPPPAIENFKTGAK